MSRFVSTLAWFIAARRGPAALALAALAIGPTIAGAHQPQRLPPENLVAAQVLMPLLQDLHKRLQPRWRVSPGTLPPSPFTGQSTGVAAVTLGRKTLKIDPEVKLALERLLKWDPTAAPGSDEAFLFDAWLKELKQKTVTVIAVKSDLGTCDTGCVVDRFARLDDTFGRSKKQREEARDRVMLEALADAVK